MYCAHGALEPIVMKKKGAEDAGAKGAHGALKKDPFAP